MADLALSTIGVKFGYAVESTAGTKPTAFTEIDNVKEIAGIDLTTDTIDVTPLSVGVKRYIAGLQDTGGTWDITFFGNTQFVTAWEALVTAYETASATGKATWFEVYIPEMTDAFYVKVQPMATIGMPNITVGTGLEFKTSNIITEYVGLDTAIEPVAA